jgi:hypothetical protein
MAQDPYHRPLLQNSWLRVFAVEACHPARAQLHVIYLGDSTVVRTVEGFAPMTTIHSDGEVTLFYGHTTVTEKNDDGVKPYRNITVEVFKKVGEWGYNGIKQKCDYPSPQLAPPLGLDITNTQSLDMRGVIATRLQIMSGDSHSRQPRGPALLIALSELELRTDEEGPTIEKQSGQVEWFGSGLPQNLTNIGKQPARLVMLEF